MKTMVRLAPALLLLLAVGGAAAEAPPRITTQGFAAATSQGSVAGEFASLRVRVEAPARITALVVRQGDFEADLATTGERELFELFGLDRRPLKGLDVTLDLAPYINRRLSEPGEYRFAIEVTDGEGRAAAATVAVEVQSALAEHTPLVPALTVRDRLTEADAMLRRRGDRPVESVGFEGLDWITLEPVDVTIRLRPSSPGSRLYALPADSWATMETAEALAAALADAGPVGWIDLPAARRGAAGRVVALRYEDGGMAVIRFTGSTTTVTPEGTVVTLAARVRRD